MATGMLTNPGLILIKITTMQMASFYAHLVRPLIDRVRQTYLLTEASTIETDRFIIVIRREVCLPLSVPFDWR